MRLALAPAATAAVPFAPGVVRFGMAFGAALLTGASGLASGRMEERQRLEEKRLRAEAHLVAYLQSILSVLETHHPSPEASFRINVMLTDGDSLKVTSAVGTYRTEELQVRWQRRQGVCGHAWAEGRTMEAPTVGAPLPGGDDALGTTRPWGMTPEQINWSRGVAWVISVPLRDGPKGEPFGVVNIDDSTPPSSEEIRTIVREVAEGVLAPNVTRILNEMGIPTDTPDVGIE